MKTDTIKSRIKNGNDTAEKLARYLNKRFGYEFEKVSLEEDKRDMIDFRCNKTQKTAQFKCRENKSDIIFEALRFYDSEKEIRVIDGRDCRTKASLYICLSSDKKRIIVATSEIIKEIAKKEVSKFENEQNDIQNLIKKAKESKNKSLKISSSKNKIETWFKVDEGVDTDEYYKLIVFIPYEAIQNSVKIDLEKTETFLDESTWK